MVYDKKIKYLTYCDRKETNTCGFAKLELREEKIQFSVGITRAGRLNGEGKIYFLLPEKKMEVGKILLKDGAGEVNIEINTESNTERNTETNQIDFYQIGGIYIACLENSYIQSIWKDERKMGDKKPEILAEENREKEGEENRKENRKEKPEEILEKKNHRESSRENYPKSNRKDGTEEGTEEKTEGRREDGTEEKTEGRREDGTEEKTEGRMEDGTEEKTEGRREDRKEEKKEDRAEDSRVEDGIKYSFAGSSKGKQKRDSEECLEKNSREVNFGIAESKWEQLENIYPHLRPFEDEREYLSIGPNDFVILTAESYQRANNSFLLHSFYQHGHLILAREKKKQEEVYYIGVPGNYCEKEKQAAVLFGFESFESAAEPAMNGEDGYYMMKTQL